MQLLKYLIQLIVALLAIGFLLVVWPGAKKEEFEQLKVSLKEGKSFVEGIGEMFKTNIPSEAELLAMEEEETANQSAPASASAPIPPSQQEDAVYPIEMSISNKSGRQIEVTVVGRSPSSVSFTRSSDGKAFAFPLESLSELDQTVISSLPINLTDDELPNPGEATNPRLESRKKSVADLKQRLAEENGKITESLTTAQKQLIRKKTTEIGEEIERLEAEIQTIRAEAP